MKHLLTLSLFLFIANISISQVACSQYNGEFGKIKKELIARARAAGAYQPDLTKKNGDLASYEKYEAAWTDESIDQIAQTWVLICRCQSAGITPSEWSGSDYDDGWAINKPLTDDDYIVQGQVKQKDESVFGDLAKPTKIYTSVDCTGGDKFAPRTKCGQKTYTASQDPQNYANAYMFARCQCEEGVPTEKRAKELEYEMKVNLANAKSYHGNNLNLPEPALKWTDCRIVGLDSVSGGNLNSQKPAPTLIYTGRESDLDRLKDQYLETFTTNETFSAYVSGENIKRIGVSMAKDFADDLEKIGKLIESTDPVALQQDYQKKIQQIETLEAKFNEESNTYFFESGQDIANSIMSKDYESVIHQGGGLLNAELARREAKKALAKQKAELERAKKSQMRALYNKAKDYNTQKRAEFLLLAANSKDLEKEKYYLGIVDNIDCYQETMWQGYLYDKPNWMENNCQMPTLASSNQAKTNFPSEDAQLSKIAEHKYAIFLKTGDNDFRNSAITFASSACSKKPSAKYFDQVAKYYASYSAILELANYLTADQMDPEFYDESGKRRIDSLKVLVELEVNQALQTNNISYIQSFLNTGLDKVVFIKDKSLYYYTISIDQPLALQTILNKAQEGKSEREAKELLQSTIMLCATNNAYRSLDKFAELGVSFDFSFKNEYPIEVAEKTLSEDAFNSILNNTEKASEYKEKYKDSPVHILLTSSISSDKASKMLESVFTTDEFSRVIDRMIDQLDNKDHYFATLGNSKQALDYLHQSNTIRNKVYKKLGDALLKTNYNNDSHLFFNYELVSFKEIPTLNDLGFSSPIKTKIIDENKSFKYEFIDGKMYHYLELEYKEIFYDLNTDLAYIAYTEHNPLLFKALDDKYDLSQSKGPNNQLLFSKILESGSFNDIYSFFNIYNFDYSEPNSRFPCGRLRPGNFGDWNNPYKGLKKAEMELEGIFKQMRDKCEEMNFAFSYGHYFYSTDFDFSEKIDGEYPLFIFLENALNASKKGQQGISQANNFVLFDLYQILSRYEFNSSIQDKNGETILHWLARHLYGTNPYLNTNMAKIKLILPNSAFIEDLKVDKELKNNNGQTAYKLFKSLALPEDCLNCTFVNYTFTGVLDKKTKKIVFTKVPYEGGSGVAGWLKEVLK